ncbi:MAG TPA: DUF4838 domain-containing protein [Candidatus Hydrogenedentes bacterium]|nr:DUF4838 domain-containing protein [Candidatus Hydrogenedentota bacterium]
MRIFFVVLAIGVLSFVTYSADALVLSRDGVSEYTIVVADGAIPAEKTAATELQEFLKQVTGATLPVQEENAAPAQGKYIFVGQSARVQAALPQVDFASLRHDGIVIKTEGDTLYLSGGWPRGTLYAVYTFLEDVVGCRWWSSTESTIPSKPTLEIPAMEKVYTPVLQYREAFYRDAFDGTFAARCKCNGHFERISPEYGGHYSILGWCHTFYQLLPPAQYFAAHPEWYSEIDGKRVSDGAQLCLTNTAMQDELVKNALEWIRKDPTAGIISIAQNDCGGNCQCAACSAIEKEEGAPSGLLIRFVNSVAERIQKEFPDVLVETLAYQYTRKAPNIARPRENVIVRLCSIECTFPEPLAMGAANADFKRDIEAWSSISHQLYIWDYVTNFAQYLLPHPNLQVLAPNIRCFVTNKAIGLFEQGDAGSSCGDFVELRAWLLAHLMWEPSRDANALIDEFLNGYYGPAAWPLRRYIDRMHDAIGRSGATMRCYAQDTSSWLELDDLNEATVLFSEAEKAVASDPVLSMRVRRARLPLDYAWLNRYAGLKRTARLRHEPFAGPADPAAASEEFIATCNGFNVGQYAEGNPFKNLETVLRARFQTPAAVPELCKNLPEDQWVDIQDNDFSLAGVGNWSQLTDDPSASDGKAARMPATHGQWAVQYPISADIAAMSPARVYVAVRCDAKVQSGNACVAGIYDSKAKAAVAQKVLTIEETKDKYAVIDLGQYSLHDDMYIWVAPMNNQDAVNAVFVDRVFFVR